MTERLTYDPGEAWVVPYLRRDLREMTAERDRLLELLDEIVNGEMAEILRLALSACRSASAALKTTSSF